MFSVSVSAQELEFIDLGIVEGEFKILQKEVTWTNNTGSKLNLSLMGKSKGLELNENKQLVIEEGETATIPFQIKLSKDPGYFEYELQLVGADNILLHGFQMGLQVLAPEIDVFKAYRNIHWPFRAKEQVFNLKAAYKGDTLQNTFDVYNLGGKDLSLSNIHANDSTWVSFEPTTIKHNQFGHMTIKMLSSKKAPSGFQKINLALIDDEKTLANLPIQFTLIPRQRYADEELVSGGPVATSSITDYDFKEMKVGEVETIEVTLANLGNDELIIENVESNCDCLTFELPSKHINSGASQSLLVTFNAAGRIGLEKKTLAIFTNDPSNPTLVITFRAHVK